MLKICKDKSAANFLIKFVYETQHMHDQRKSLTECHLGFRLPLTLYMTHSCVLFVAQGRKCFIYHNIKWQPTFVELATTLTYLGAKCLQKKKLILCPALLARNVWTGKWPSQYYKLTVIYKCSQENYMNKIYLDVLTT